MNVLQKVLKKGLCTGCGLCESCFGKAKLAMQHNHNGYLRPFIKQELSQPELRLLKQICPALNCKMKTLTENHYHPAIGNYQGFMLGWAKDNYIRKNSSTGGALSAVLLYLIEQQVVDGIIHVGADPDNPYENKVCVSRSYDEIAANAGSRYMPSAPLVNIDEIIRQEGKYAFVGRPCDVRALRAYMEEKNIIEEKIVVTLAFLCGGVPSIKGTYKMLSQMKLTKEEVIRVKYRGNGWPGKVQAFTKDSQIHEMSYNESWGRYLGPTSQLICKLCFDGVGESADLVFGDAWNCNEKGYPDFNEADGRNMIIVRTKLGDQIIRESAKQEYLYLESAQSNPDIFMNMQPSQTSRRKTALERILGMRFCLSSYPRVDWQYLRKICMRKYWFQLNFRSLAGTIKRVFTTPK